MENGKSLKILGLLFLTAIIAGRIADRTGNKNLVLYISMAGAVVSLLLIAQGVAVVSAVLLSACLRRGLPVS